MEKIHKREIGKYLEGCNLGLRQSCILSSFYYFTKRKYDLAVETISKNYKKHYLDILTIRLHSKIVSVLKEEKLVKECREGKIDSCFLR